jgi:hypothetical protein
VTGWTSDELRTIGNAEAFQLAAVRSDGTLGEPVALGMVLVRQGLYVRAYRGPDSSWFRATRLHRRGRIWVDGLQKSVAYALTRRWPTRSTPRTGRSTATTRQTSSTQ